MKSSQERGRKNQILSLSVHLSAHGAEGTHFLHVCFILRRIIEFHEHAVAESTRDRYPRTVSSLRAAIAPQFLFQDACASFIQVFIRRAFDDDTKRALLPLRLRRGRKEKIRLLRLQSGGIVGKLESYGPPRFCRVRKRSVRKGSVFSFKLISETVVVEGKKAFI